MISGESKYFDLISSGYELLGQASNYDEAMWKASEYRKQIPDDVQVIIVEKTVKAKEVARLHVIEGEVVVKTKEIVRYGR